MVPQLFSNLLIISMICTCLITAAPARADLEAPEMFGSATETDGLDTFSKWTNMLLRHARQSSKGSVCDAGLADCAYEAWLVRLLGLAEADPLERVATVNRWVNQRRYVSDTQAFGIRDYWATPREFLSGAGDCEDFAILKYLSLRALGMQAEDMRIVVVEDTRDNASHAVLIVRIDDRSLVLDNRNSALKAPAMISHYEPYYAVNEHGWWRADG